MYDTIPVSKRTVTTLNCAYVSVEYARVARRLIDIVMMLMVNRADDARITAPAVLSSTL